MINFLKKVIKKGKNGCIEMLMDLQIFIKLLIIKKDQIIYPEAEARIEFIRLSGGLDELPKITRSVIIDFKSSRV